MKDPKDLVSAIHSNEEIAGAHGDPEELSPAWFTQQGLFKMRDQLRDELEAARRSELDLVVDGDPVLAGTLDVDFLTKALSALRDSISAVGQVLRGEPTSRGVVPGPLREETSLRLVGTFAGSFGLALQGPRLPVQLSMDDDNEGSLFEESVGTILEILEAAEEDEFEEVVLDRVSALSSRVVFHLKKLSSVVAADNVRTRLQWRPPDSPERTVTFASANASRLEELLSETEIAERSLELEGHLSGALLVGGRFEFIKADGDVIRGRVDPPLLEQIPMYFNEDCIITLRVATARSRVDGKEAESYTLIDIR